MPQPVAPTIQQFEAAAELLNLQNSTTGLDEAIATLAAWMDLAADHLTEDDRAELIKLGGILYREGFNKRVPLQARYRKNRPL